MPTSSKRYCVEGKSIPNGIYPPTTDLPLPPLSNYKIRKKKKLKIKKLFDIQAPFGKKERKVNGRENKR